MTCVRVGGARRRGRGFICTADGPLAIPFPDCPDAALHTPEPTGYLAVMEWADEMMETHDQARCPGCGRLVIWVPKEPT